MYVCMQVGSVEGKHSRSALKSNWLQFTAKTEKFCKQNRARENTMKPTYQANYNTTEQNNPRAIIQRSTSYNGVQQPESYHTTEYNNPTKSYIQRSRTIRELSYNRVHHTTENNPRTIYNRSRTKQNKVEKSRTTSKTCRLRYDKTI